MWANKCNCFYDDARLFVGFDAKGMAALTESCYLTIVAWPGSLCGGRGRERQRWSHDLIPPLPFWLLLHKARPALSGAKLLMHSTSFPTQL